MTKKLMTLSLVLAGFFALCSCETVATVDKGDITAAIKISVTNITSSTAAISGTTAQEYVTSCYFLKPVLSSEAKFTDKDAIDKKDYILKNASVVSLPLAFDASGLAPGTSYTVAMLGMDASGTFRTAPYYVTFTTSK